jgi:hypothetical protein
MQKLLLIMLSLSLASFSFQAFAWPKDGGTSTLDKALKNQALNNRRVTAGLACSGLTAVWMIPFILKYRNFTLQSDKAHYIGIGPKAALGVSYVIGILGAAWLTLGNLGGEFFEDTPEQTSVFSKTIAVLAVLATVGALPGGYFASQC